MATGRSSHARACRCLQPGELDGHAAPDPADGFPQHLSSHRRRPHAERAESATGIPLDSQGNGDPGSNYVTTLTAKDLVHTPGEDREVSSSESETRLGNGPEHKDKVDAPGIRAPAAGRAHERREAPETAGRPRPARIPVATDPSRS